MSLPMPKTSSSGSQTDLLTYSQCKQHWNNMRARYRVMAEEFSARILAIEEPGLRWTVAAMIDSLASAQNCGSLVVKREGLEFQVIRIDLDPEVLDALFTKSSEEDIVAAYTWIVDQLQDVPLTWVGWAIGRLELQPPAPRLRSIHEHVVYDFDNQRIAGISPHKNGTGVNRIIRVEL